VASSGTTESKATEVFIVDASFKFDVVNQGHLTVAGSSPSRNVFSTLPISGATDA
jgi:hypothetical protein